MYQTERAQRWYNSYLNMSLPVHLELSEQQQPPRHSNIRPLSRLDPTRLLVPLFAPHPRPLRPRSLPALPSLTRISTYRLRPPPAHLRASTLPTAAARPSFPGSGDDDSNDDDDHNDDHNISHDDGDNNGKPTRRCTLQASLLVQSRLHAPPRRTTHPNVQPRPLVCSSI